MQFLNWKRGFVLAGVVLMVIAGRFLLSSSGAGCGVLIAGRWSLPVFTGIVLLILCGIAALSVGRLATEERTRDLGQGILLMGISLGITLGIIDLTFRLTDPPRVPQTGLYENHDSLGYFFTPNLSFEAQSRTGEYRHLFYFDEQGLIIRGESNRPRPDAYRILFIGDSMLRAFEVGAEENLSVVAARQIEATTGEDTQQINLGVNGYSPLRYGILYRLFREVYTPDVVVLMIYAGNDFTEDARLLRDNQVLFDAEGQPTAIHPYIDQEAGTIWLNNNLTTTYEQAYTYRYPAEAWHQGVIGMLRALIVRPVCKNLEVKSFIPAEQFDGVYRPDQFENGEELPCKNLSGELTQFCTNYRIRDQSLIRNNSYAIFKENYEEADQEDISRMLDTLNLLTTEIEDDGRELLILIIPAAHQIPGQSEGLKAVAGMEPGEVIDSTAPQDILLEFCQTNRLNCLDLLPLFRTQSEQKLYYDNDFHMTAVAHELIGHLIAEHFSGENQP